MPDGCAFRCRDNMTSCESAAKTGKCETHGETMRFQCPQSCGVCKALEFPTGEAYPRHACRLESGDTDDHKERCPTWAADGECVNNFGFMSLSCELSCGLCVTSEGGVPKSVSAIMSPPKPPKKAGGKKTKKRKKKVAASAEGSAAGGAEAAEAADGSPEGGAESSAEAAAPTETPSEKVEEPAPAEKAEGDATAEASAPASGGDEGKKGKKKGWVSGMKEAVKAAFKGNKKPAADKDEA